MIKSTLVIHPDDRSTDFLKYIYQDLHTTTVVTGDKNQDEIINMICENLGNIKDLVSL
jgi:hypothetical protein